MWTNEREDVILCALPPAVDELLPIGGAHNFPPSRAEQFIHVQIIFWADRGLAEAAWQCLCLLALSHIVVYPTYAPLLLLQIFASFAKWGSSLIVSSLSPAICLATKSCPSKRFANKGNSILNCACIGSMAAMRPRYEHRLHWRPWLASDLVAFDIDASTWISENWRNFHFFWGVLCRVRRLATIPCCNPVTDPAKVEDFEILHATITYTPYKFVHRLKIQYWQPNVNDLHLILIARPSITRD